MIKLILFIVSLTCVTGHAAARRRPASVSGTTSAASPGAAAHRSVRQPNWGYAVGLLSWQEQIKIESGGSSGYLLTQSLGLDLKVIYDVPMRSARWLYGYTGALQVGTLKGSGTTTNITDTFKDNRWFALQGAANLTYRTTSVSAVRFVIPLTYRMISWEIGSNSTSRPDRKTGFSLGYGAEYVNNFNPRSALLVGVAHQQLWNATQWMVSFRRSLR